MLLITSRLEIKIEWKVECNEVIKKWIKTSRLKSYISKWGRQVIGCFSINIEIMQSLLEINARDNCCSFIFYSILKQATAELLLATSIWFFRACFFLAFGNHSHQTWNVTKLHNCSNLKVESEKWEKISCRYFKPEVKI